YTDAQVPQPADLLGPWPGKPDYLKNTLAWRKDAGGRVVAGKSGEKVGDEAGGKGTGFAEWVRQVNECVPAVDEGVGELLAALKQTGQLDNTLVVYTADQGFAMGEHGLRMKIAPYDASYRSPLIVSMPGTVAAGKVCRHTPNAPDLVATFFAVSGVKPPADLHGRDLTPLLKDPSAAWPHPVLYEHTGHDFGADVAMRGCKPDPPVNEAVERSGERIYVADWGNHRIVRMDDMRGTNWTALGSEKDAPFRFPVGVHMDAAGRVYVAEQRHDRLIRV